MNKAYSILELKSVDEDKRIITGVASTITPDRMDDIVEPKGAKYRLPIPLLSQHDHHLPIGEITKASVQADKITIEAVVSRDTGLEYVETAWKQIKSKLVRGLSIGFRTLEYAFIKDSGGIHIKEWEWYELSAVTIPANSEATISTIKSYDQDKAKRAQVLKRASIHPEVKRALAMRKALTNG